MNPLKRTVDRLVRPLAWRLDRGPGTLLGIRNSMRLARRYNRFLYGRYQRFRERLHRERFDELVRENDGAGGDPPIRMEDGWALDTSGNLPYLEELLRDADEIIEERGGTLPATDEYRSFFRHLTEVADLERWPSLVDFVTSSPVLAAVSDYLGFVPALSKTLPTGIRVVESGLHLDSLSHLPPRDSQLYHIDPYDHPMVYVIVLLRDCSLDSGPFTFLPASASRRAAKRLGYWSRAVPYRVSDEELFAVADRSEEIRLTYPKGTVLFIDTSHCFHYGSRNATEPRFQLMYALTSMCRCDFSETYMPSFAYPGQESGPRLRRMVLDRRYLE